MHKYLGSRLLDLLILLLYILRTSIILLVIDVLFVIWESFGGRGGEEGWILLFESHLTNPYFERNLSRKPFNCAMQCKVQYSKYKERQHSLHKWQLKLFKFDLQDSLLKCQEVFKSFLIFIDPKTILSKLNYPRLIF